MLLKASEGTGEPLLAAAEPAASMPKTCSASRQSATASASSPQALLCRPHSAKPSIFWPCHALRLAAPEYAPTAVRGKVARMPHSLHRSQRRPHAGCSGSWQRASGMRHRPYSSEISAILHRRTRHLPSCSCMPGLRATCTASQSQLHGLWSVKALESGRQVAACTEVRLTHLSCRSPQR